MDAKWTVIGFGHRANGVHYTWTHSAINITTELTPEQVTSVMAWAEEHDVWFHSKHTLFLCANADQVTTIEAALDGQSIKYETEASRLTPLQKLCIEDAQISRRDQIEAAISEVHSVYYATVTAVDVGTPRGITVQRGAIELECYGTMVPSVGDTVIVTFGDNSPDKPVVIGKILGV